MNGSSWNRRAKRDGDNSRGGTSVENPKRRRCGKDVEACDAYGIGRAQCEQLEREKLAETTVADSASGMTDGMQSASEAEEVRSSVSQSIPGDSAPSAGDESERQREIQHARVQPLVQPQGDRSRGDSSKFNAETELGNDTASVAVSAVAGTSEAVSAVAGTSVAREIRKPREPVGHSPETPSPPTAQASASSHPGLAPSPPAASSSASSGLVCSRRELDVPDTASDDCISDADIDYSWVFDTGEDAWSCVAEAGSDIEDRGEILLRVSPLSADPDKAFEFMVPPDATIGHFIHKHKKPLCSRTPTGI